MPTRSATKPHLFVAMGSSAGTVPSKILCAVESPQDEAEQKVEFAPENLGIEQKGEFLLAGRVRPEAIETIATHVKSWIDLLTENEMQEDDGARMQALKSLGVAVEQHPCNSQTDEAGAEKLLEAMARLPRPTMISCRSGNRAGSALLLFLAKQRGCTAETAHQLATDMDLKFWTRCTSCGPQRDWVLKQLPNGKVMAPLLQKTHGSVVQQLFDPVSCTFTYLIGCLSCKTALLIDPVLEQQHRDLAMVDELGFDLRFVLNTHVHADHVTSGGNIKKERPTVHTIISEVSQAKSDFRVRHGDSIRLGMLELEVRATPGHTAGCLSYFLRPSSSHDGPGMVFTGDALLIHGCGRTDFQQGDSEQLFESVHKQIFSLPDETLVYPGHDYKGRNVSTVGDEKTFNPRLSKSKEEFKKIMSELNLPYPKKIDTAVPANMVCGIQD